MTDKSNWIQEAMRRCCISLLQHHDSHFSSLLSSPYFCCYKANSVGFVLHPDYITFIADYTSFMRYKFLAHYMIFMLQMPSMHLTFCNKVVLHILYPLGRITGAFCMWHYIIWIPWILLIPFKWNSNPSNVLQGNHVLKLIRCSVTDGFLKIQHHLSSFWL